MNENDLFEQAWKAYRQASRIRLDDSHYDSALVFLDQIIKQNPNFANAYHLRASIRHTRRDDAGAIKDADYAIKLEPYHADHYYNRGCYRNTIKDYAGALSDFRYAKELAIEQGDGGLVDAADHYIPDLEQRLGLSE